MEDRVKIDVNGQVFKVPPTVIESYPSSRLARVYRTEVPTSKTERIIFNRPSESFAAILAFHQTGELHIPMTSCPGAFIKELKFWEIPPEMLSLCCYNKLQCFLDEQSTLQDFKEKQEQRTKENSKSVIGRVRTKLWQVVDYTKPTIIGKIYFTLTCLMVMLSIAALAYSTDSSFQRKMTNCERLEYMALTDMEGYKLMKPHLEQTCNDSKPPENSDQALDKGNTTNPYRLKLFSPVKLENDSQNLYYKAVIVEEITLEEMPAIVENNFGETTLEPIDDYIQELENDLNVNKSVVLITPLEELIPINITNGETDRETPRNKVGPPVTFLLHHLHESVSIKVPNLMTRILVILFLECLSSIYFTIDIILRLVSCPSLKLYFLSIINVADAMSLVGGYAYLMLYYWFPSLRYGSWIDWFSYMQMLRSLRLFRIVSNVRAGRVLAYSMRQNFKDISVVCLFLLTGTFTFATLFYLTESTVKSIPDAWYWALITMTTVGYGDIHPVSAAGRIVACVCAVLGILLLALTVPIFANHFIILYQHVEADDNRRGHFGEQKRTEVETEKKIPLKI